MIQTAHASKQPQGLTEADAQANLAKGGFNELPRADKRTPFRIVLEVLREPMLALLLGSGVIYLLLGELKDSIILMAFAMMSVVITVVQETRTENVLEALRDLTSPRAMVIRDGVRKRIAGRDVVLADLIVLAEGDRVPADAKLLQSHDLQTDESLLTGESVAVRKLAHQGESTLKNTRLGGDDLPYVFSGSLVVRGQGLAQVTAIGIDSEIGKIVHSLSSLETEPPRLQTEMSRLVKLFAVLGGIVSIAAVLLYGFMRGSWLDATLAGIALGMAMLPEEFPVVLTIFMAMGAWRISQAHVLTRRASSIETLGSAAVLCTDKTGTLTENHMTIAALLLPDYTSIWHREKAGSAAPSKFSQLMEFGYLASAAVPFDPMDKAFHELKAENSNPNAKSELKLLHAYGLRPDLLAMSQVWQADGGKKTNIVAAKGAPEAIANLCHFSAKELAVLKHSIDSFAAKGLRVLGVAQASFTGRKWPKSQQDFKFKFLGLVGLADPLRGSVPEAVKQCQSAGIRVLMITGDYPTTAKAIANQAGLDATEVVTGEELAKLSDTELAVRVKTAAVFARIMPEQKLRIVMALKTNGDVVAMTGDGVNDSPSLKAANIGIAMGGRGTDVAREASSIVLLDDDFGSIVKAIALGRRIYDNLRKAMAFIFAVHVPIAGLTLLPLLFGLPILFGPVHIAFLELIIDPVCALVFEAESEEGDVMSRPPRDPNEPLFTRHMIIWSICQGGLALALVFVIYIMALKQGMPIDEVRALSFFSLVMTIVGLIFVNRSFSASIVTAFTRKNNALKWVLAGVTALLGLTLIWPFAANLLRFGPLHLNDLAVTVAAGLVVLLALEFTKPIVREWLKH